MTATGTNVLAQAIRARILDHIPEDETTALRAQLGERVWLTQAPDNAGNALFVVFSLYGGGTGDGDDSRIREMSELEVQTFVRPRAAQQSAEALMDRIESNFMQWSEDVGGLFTLRGRISRNTLPPFPAPADRELVQVRALFLYTWWPTFRSSRAVAAGSASP